MKEKNKKIALSDNNATKLVFETFKIIADYNSILEVKEFAKNEIGTKEDKNREKKYPKITFAITKEDIQSLKDSALIQENFNLNEELGSLLTDPLNKLLYSVIWKNGDLKKIKHIIKGILDDVDKNEQEDALVFYHFGKHLTHATGQPIIDQHVLRAFELYRCTDANSVLIRKIRRNDKCRNQELISAYKAWWLKTVDNKINGNMEHAYQIDKLLFEVGKKIKLSKKKDKFPKEISS